MFIVEEVGEEAGEEVQLPHVLAHQSAFDEGRLLGVDHTGHVHRQAGLW